MVDPQILAVDDRRGGGVMSRFLPRSLVGRFGLLLVIAVVVAQGVAVVIFLSETSGIRRANARTQGVDRMATLVRAIDAASPSSRDDIVRAFRSPVHHYSTSDTPLVAAAAMGEQEQQMAQRLPGLTHNRAHDPRIALVERNRDAEDDGLADLLGRPRALEISVQLADGIWLNDEAVVRSLILSAVNVGDVWLYILAGSVTAMVVVIMFTVRWITRPLTALAEAADRVGRGESAELLSVTGPYEITRTVKAFNVMQHRLSRFMSDRLMMLAAISHDLRTPMTAARLRAEMIDDAEVKDAIVRSLTEMQYITETTLSFARDETVSEEPRLIDLPSLVEAVADDLAAIAQHITISGDYHLQYRCRPALMRRALNNLMSNAVKYGKRARIAFHLTNEHARIMIDDEGPGLPEDQLERVFEPFVRIDQSRSSETGGIGLGLSIARTIIRAHGGEVKLCNLAGGLRAEVVLPRDRGPA
jgi:signal transduction histidine kinase